LEILKQRLRSIHPTFLGLNPFFQREIVISWPDITNLSKIEIIIVIISHWIKTLPKREKISTLLKPLKSKICTLTQSLHIQKLVINHVQKIVDIINKTKLPCCPSLMLYLTSSTYNIIYSHVTNYTIIAKHKQIGWANNINTYITKIKCTHTHTLGRESSIPRFHKTWSLPCSSTLYILRWWP